MLEQTQDNTVVEKWTGFGNLPILALITVLAAILRFYNLNWDGPFSLHPDEQNIETAVKNLYFRTGDLNPNFFAYGAFPIYLIYIAAHQHPSEVVLAGRILSAVLSVFIVPVLYFVSTVIVEFFSKQKLPTAKLASAAALVAAFSPGLIQYAHFATFEMMLTLQYLGIGLIAMQVVKTGKWRYYLLLGLFIGMSIATKVVSLAMLPILVLADCFFRISLVENSQSGRVRQFFSLVSGLANKKFLAAFSFSLVVSFVLSPFNLIDFEEFKKSMEYEHAVATGSLVVSYTQKFLETTPISYQYARVFPYILGFPLTLLGTIGLLVLLHHSARTFNQYLAGAVDQTGSASIAVFVFVPISYALFHFRLYVKWTRYMVPLVPFLILGAVLVLSMLPLKKAFLVILLILLSLVSVLKGLDFFAIYLQQDPRILAANWLKKNALPGSKILVERESGILPIQQSVHPGDLHLFDFYKLDGPEGEKLLAELEAKIRESRIIVILSNNYPSRFRSLSFPRGKEFYKALDNNSLGFRHVAEFSRTTVLEKWWVIDGKLETKSRLFKEEESFRIFDHPTVSIYERF